MECLVLLRDALILFLQHGQRELQSFQLEQVSRLDLQLAIQLVHARRVLFE